ncbi:Lrp/AsnC family transcriptional regulator [Streptomyces sp. Z26]|uniref:Lrp/AsnC family transcriptional regulator n=1 Tax=Streptomyces TaxID=1883 RepID=UPI000EF15338|nr:Lrp/AsnC family transcriptional regulator [Streptomyces sp. Z26]RLL70814.1 Lrp/AsnC family transcriptional regulator [Streptomyces sp. Z26]
MDRTDRAIIAHLTGNGRLTNTELADRVGLSPSPCLRRVRQLESDGVITGYHASVAPEALGRGFRVLVHVEMSVQDKGTIEAFEETVAGFDEVVHCLRLFGQPDYVLWVAVPDLATYERFYLNRLTGLPGVARTNSQFTMKTVKSTPGLGLPTA